MWSFWLEAKLCWIFIVCLYQYCHWRTFYRRRRVGIFLCSNDLRWEVLVCWNIGGIVDHRCLNVHDHTYEVSWTIQIKKIKKGIWLEMDTCASILMYEHKKEGIKAWNHTLLHQIIMFYNQTTWLIVVAIWKKNIYFDFSILSYVCLFDGV